MAERGRAADRGREGPALHRVGDARLERGAVQGRGSRPSPPITCPVGEIMIFIVELAADVGVVDLRALMAALHVGGVLLKDLLAPWPRRSSSRPAARSAPWRSATPASRRARPAGAGRGLRLGSRRRGRGGRRLGRRGRAATTGSGAGGVGRGRLRGRATAPGVADDGLAAPTRGLARRRGRADSRSKRVGVDGSPRAIAAFGTLEGPELEDDAIPAFDRALPRCACFPPDSRALTARPRASPRRRVHRGRPGPPRSWLR